MESNTIATWHAVLILSMAVIGTAFVLIYSRCCVKSYAKLLKQEEKELDQMHSEFRAERAQIAEKVQRDKEFYEFKKKISTDLGKIKEGIES